MSQGDRGPMDQFAAHLDRGWDLVSRGDLAGALVSAEKSLELDAASPEAHNLLGQADAHAVVPGQSHDATHTPRAQTEPRSHVIPSQGSAHPKPRQIWPKGQRTPGWQLGAHVRVTRSHVCPGPQPYTAQSSGTQRHAPLGWRVSVDRGAHPKSSRSRHSGRHIPFAHPLSRPQLSARAPLQFESRGESHASGAPGKIIGSASLQSHGSRAAQLHATNPSPSLSGQDTSHPGPTPAEAAPAYATIARAVASESGRTRPFIAHIMTNKPRPVIACRRASRGP